MEKEEMNTQILAALCVATTSTALVAEPQVPYPEGYPDWHHVKSMVIEEGHPLFTAFGGIHHIYANDQALEGYRNGHFADGAVIIFDLLEAAHANNAITEGQRKVLGVLHKDTKKFATTGGCGFEGFGEGNPSNRVVNNNASSVCFNCHQPQKEQDYVFSKLR
jgi:hypothetical protein